MQLGTGLWGCIGVLDLLLMGTSNEVATVPPRSHHFKLPMVYSHLLLLLMGGSPHTLTANMVRVLMMMMTLI